MGAQRLTSPSRPFQPHSKPQSPPPQVPGVGERTAEAFANNGINSTYQLLGWALMQQDGKRSQAQIADKVFDFVKSEKDSAVREKSPLGGEEGSCVAHSIPPCTPTCCRPMHAAGASPNNLQS